MFWILTEGLSWPGGLEGGRFNIFRLPANEADIADHLAHGFRVDDRERACIETWADDGFASAPGPAGIRVRVFRPSFTSASTPNEIDEEYWAAIRLQQPVYSEDLHYRAQIAAEADRLAKAYSNSG